MTTFIRKSLAFQRTLQEEAMPSPRPSPSPRRGTKGATKVAASGWFGVWSPKLIIIVTIISGGRIFGQMTEEKRKVNGRKE